MECSYSCKVHIHEYSLSTRHMKSYFPASNVTEPYEL